MNYKVKAVRRFRVGEDTKLEDYEKNLNTYDEVKKEMRRLIALGEYCNVHYVENSKEGK